MWNKFELFRKNILLIVTIAMVFLLANFSLNLKSSDAQQDVKWQSEDVKWQYLTIVYTEDEISPQEVSSSYCISQKNNQDKLNEYGEKGWELVLYHDVGNEDNCKEAIFKRRFVQIKN
ncbi:MAG: hypothetical protein AB4372_18265 [Xenococcus sp. (in: cyanobacteria)]